MYSRGVMNYKHGSLQQSRLLQSTCYSTSGNSGLCTKLQTAPFLLCVKYCKYKLPHVFLAEWNALKQKCSFWRMPHVLREFKRPCHECFFLFVRLFFNVAIHRTELWARLVGRQWMKRKCLLSAFYRKCAGMGQRGKNLLFKYILSITYVCYWWSYLFSDIIITDRCWPTVMKFGLIMHSIVRNTGIESLEVGRI
jgi:hypothetical protein